MEEFIMRYLDRCFTALLLIAVLSASSAQAGGLFSYELGTPDVGLASAGYAARAEDASTLFTNPAGMARLQGSNVMLGAQAIYGKVKFDPGVSTGPQTGNDGENALGWVPGGSFFFTQQVSNNMAFGIGAFSYFGGAVDYNETWVGRFYNQNSLLAGMTLMPAVAIKVNDVISVGAGLNAMYGMFKNEKAVHNIEPGTDGKLTLEDNEWGYGANVGILFELGKGTRIGVTYLSEVKLNFQDTPEFENIGPGLTTVLQARGLDTAAIDLGVNVPQCVMVSIYQKLGGRFALMANAGWQDWSRFGEVEVGVNTDNPVSLTTETKYEDTWHAALGGQLQATDALMLSVGVAYDSSMLKDEDRVPSLPVGATWRGGLGTQYALSERTKIGLDYEFMWSGDLDMSRTSALGGELTGTYKDTYVHVIALNAALRF
jgi:long-chain fatty acid transport protein